MKMTQVEMVEFLDMGRPNYSRIEKGEIFPNLSTLKTLQEKFGLNPNWIITNMGEMFLQGNKGERFDFGKYEGEVEDLLVHMGKVPALKHAVLAHFYEYKAMHEDTIEAAFNPPEPETE